MLAGGKSVLLASNAMLSSDAGAAAGLGSAVAASLDGIGDVAATAGAAGTVVSGAGGVGVVADGVVDAVAGTDSVTGAGAAVAGLAGFASGAVTAAVDVDATGAGAAVAGAGCWLAVSVFSVSVFVAGACEVLSAVGTGMPVPCSICVGDGTVVGTASGSGGGVWATSVCATSPPVVVVAAICVVALASLVFAALAELFAKVAAEAEPTSAMLLVVVPLEVPSLGLAAAALASPVSVVAVDALSVAASDAGVAPPASPEAGVAEGTGADDAVSPDAAAAVACDPTAVPLLDVLLLSDDEPAVDGVAPVAVAAVVCAPAPLSVDAVLSDNLLTATSAAGALPLVAAVSAVFWAAGVPASGLLAATALSVSPADATCVVLGLSDLASAIFWSGELAFSDGVLAAGLAAAAVLPTGDAGLAAETFFFFFDETAFCFWLLGGFK